MTTRDKGITAPTIDPATIPGRFKYQGTVTFTAALTANIVFGASEADTNYKVYLTPYANKTFWVSAKTVNGFTVSASAVSSDSVDWAISR